MFVHLILDGVSESALGVGVDTIAAAERLVTARLAPQALAPRVLRQQVVSMDGRAVRSGAGRRIAVDGALDSLRLRRGDLVVVPGVSAATEPTLAALLSRPAVRRAGEALGRLRARGVVIAASCSATFVLGAAGLLDGGPATTSWWLGATFRRRFPAVQLAEQSMVVDAGEVITAGAALAHADLMLALLARAAGVELARLVARYLILDDRPSQARYLVHEHLRVADPAVAAAERFAAAHVERQIGLAELARAAGVSTRTLTRRIRAALGMSPTQLIQRARVARAAHLLDTSAASVEEIAWKVGYADPAAFRRVFRRLTGESPRGRGRRRATVARTDRKKA